MSASSAAVRVEAATARAASRADMPSLTILYLVTEDWYFMSHRLGLARAARAAGHRVVIGTRCNQQRAQIEQAGFEVVDLPFERSLRMPWRDLRALWALCRLLRTLRPDILHLVSLKPILLGGIARDLVARRTPALCAFTGLGYVFSSDDRLARGLRPWILRGLRGIAREPRVWVLSQNDTDAALLREAGVGAPARARVIHGSGIDLDAWPATPLPRDVSPQVLFPARLLVDKGIHEFVAAARVVRARRPQVRFVMAGAHDRDNHAAVTQAQLDGWLAEGVVEWRGHVRDMAALYREASIVCLPSYREGLPKVLLEAAACARPLVATDVPGCREICRHQETGLCVPPQDSLALAAAIERLLDEPATAERCARAARELAAREFALPRVAAATLELYRDMRAAA